MTPSPVERAACYERSSTIRVEHALRQGRRPYWRGGCRSMSKGGGCPGGRGHRSSGSVSIEQQGRRDSVQARMIAAARELVCPLDMIQKSTASCRAHQLVQYRYRHSRPLLLHLIPLSTSLLQHSPLPNHPTRSINNDSAGALQRRSTPARPLLAPLRSRTPKSHTSISAVSPLLARIRSETCDHLLLFSRWATLFGGEHIGSRREGGV